MARPLFDTEYIFGIHEPGGEQHMLDAGKPGWVLFTEEIGHDPNNKGGKDFRAYSSRNLGVICRLNNGYEPDGTIPHSSLYEDFAKRCANYVAASRGCKIWIIGNEMNYVVERPEIPGRQATVASSESGVYPPISTPPPFEHGPDGGSFYNPNNFMGWMRSLVNDFLHGMSGGMGDAELKLKPPVVISPSLPSPRRIVSLDTDSPPTRAAVVAPQTRAAATREVITPALYAQCYQRCRDAIRRVPGHENDQVLVGSVAPWNAQTTYAGNPTGDWIQYFQDILTLLGPDGCDGFTLHTYTHQADVNLINSGAKMNAPFQNRHFEFLTYRDFMEAVPATMRHLPAYITETDQNVPWLNDNIGWVQTAYNEIDWWNKQANHQQIRALILYRWPKIDQWYIEGKAGVISDFQESLRNDFRWKAVAPSPAKPSAQTTLLQRGDQVELADIVNLRSTPGYIGKTPSDILIQLPKGTKLQIEDSASRRMDSLTWWRVKTLDTTHLIVGWIAQFGLNGTVLLVKVDGPTQPPAPPVAAGTFRIGDTVHTLTTVRMRRSPGYRNKPANDVVADIPNDSDGTVLDGPREADGLTWWQVQTTNAANQSVTGWMAEAVGGTKLLDRVELPTPPITEPVAPPVTPPVIDTSFAIGDHATTLSFVRLRRTPGYLNKPFNDIIADIWQDTSVTILAGPEDEDGLTWWQVETQTSGGQRVQGWMAEKAPGDVPLLEKSDTTSEPAPSITSTFSVGDTVETTQLARLRRSAGYLNKPENDVLGEVQPEAIGRLVKGPRQADNLLWWEVATTLRSGQPIIGWMAESAPGGLPILRLAGGDGGTTAPSASLAAGDLVMTTGALRVRRTPGYKDKPANDILGEYTLRTTLNLSQGPQLADGLAWWRVGGIARQGQEIIGWVAEAVNESKLLTMALPLAGTTIPDKVTQSYLGIPFAGAFGVSQLWGENPAIYSRFTYDGVPLRGHNGIDFFTPRNTPILAVYDGRVVDARFDPGGFGNYIKLTHSWGESLYAHLEGFDVQIGEQVTRGSVIGRSGNSGNSSGPHLHYAIRINPYDRRDGWGGFSDPLPYTNPGEIILPAYVRSIAPLSTVILPSEDRPDGQTMAVRVPEPLQEKATPSALNPEADSWVRP